MSDLDVIRLAIEERDDALEKVELMAREMVYRGNSVQHWHAKATAYGDCIMRIWKVLDEAGVKRCGDVVDTVRSLLPSTADQPSPALIDHIAEIAHAGGLRGLSEADALIAIRRLTLPHWDTTGGHDARASRVDAALTEAARATDPTSAGPTAR